MTKPVDIEAVRQQLSFLPDSWAEATACEGVTGTYYEVLMDRENYALWVNVPGWLAELVAEVERLREIVEAAQEVTRCGWRFATWQLPGSMRADIDHLRAAIDAWRGGEGND